MIVNASVASVVTSVTSLIVPSSSRGRSSTSASPMMGVNTTRLRAQASKPCAIETLPSESNCEDERHSGDAEEHEQGVFLESAVLQLAQQAAALAGDHRGAVVHAVDTALVDVAIHETCRDRCDAASGPQHVV